MTTLLTNSTTGYTDTSSGFAPPLPTVGTITRKFAVEQNPWNIIATNGTYLGSFEKIVLSVSKSVNINNETNCFVSFGLVPIFKYSPSASSGGIMKMSFRSGDGVVLIGFDVNLNGKFCKDDLFSYVKEFDATFFDTISSVLLSIPPTDWQAC